MLGHLKPAMPLLGFVPLALLIVCNIASAQVEETSSDPQTDQSNRADEARNDNPSIRLDERPSIQFNVTRGTGPRLPEEQVIVRGQLPPSGYRRRVHAAVEETWAAFNEVNSDDRYDVHCRYEARTGTRILQHVCRPQFLDEALSRAAGAFLQLDKGSSFGMQQFELARVYYMEQRLNGELRGLATSDPNLREQLENLDEQLQRYEEARRRED